MIRQYRKAHILKKHKEKIINNDQEKLKYLYSYAIKGKIILLKNLIINFFELLKKLACKKSIQ